MAPLAKVFTILAGGYSNILTTFTFNPQASTIVASSTSPGGDSPSWVAQHPVHKNLVYAVNELPLGQVLAFNVDKDGIATKLDNVTSGGNGPAFAGFVQGGKFLGAFNFGDGTASFLPVSPDGRSFTTDDPPVIKFDAPVSNPHEGIEHGDEILVPDLGADKIWRVAQDKDGVFAVQGSFDVGAGKGPRHGVVIDESLYILTEKTSEVIQQIIPPLGQQAQTVATISIIPEGVNATNLFAGEIITANGILYASNRNIGPADPRGDSIAVFETKPVLKLVNQVFTGLKNLRGMALSPDNQFIVVGGKETGGIAVFSVVGKDLTLAARNLEVDATTSYVWL